MLRVGGYDLLANLSALAGKSDEMLTKELALKKEGESELKDAQRQVCTHHTSLPLPIARARRNGMERSSE